MEGKCWCGRRHRKWQLAVACWDKDRLVRFGYTVGALPWYVDQVIERLGWNPRTAQEIEAAHAKVEEASEAFADGEFSPARTFYNIVLGLVGTSVSEEVEDLDRWIGLETLDRLERKNRGEE